jgi:CRISPR/Cas system-associated endonuclease Cas1
MIEEFRAFVVDRVVFTLINQNQHLKIDKDGKLDVKTRQLLTRKILEKIGSYTKHKKATKKIDTIIEEQAYLLARAIRGIATYRAFIGKY